MSGRGPLVLGAAGRLSKVAAALSIYSERLGPAVVLTEKDFLARLEAEPAPGRPLLIDPAALMLSNEDGGAAGMLARIRAPFSILDFVGWKDSLSPLRKAWAEGGLPRKGVLRITRRRPSRSELECDEIDLLVFICRWLGGVERLRGRRISVPGGPDELQDLAIIRAGSGALVHLDCSCLAHQAGKDGWEYASAGSLLACDEARDCALRMAVRGKEAFAEFPDPAAAPFDAADAKNELELARSAASAWQALQAAAGEGA